MSGYSALVLTVIYTLWIFLILVFYKENILFPVRNIFFLRLLPLSFWFMLITAQRSCKCFTCTHHTVRQDWHPFSTLTVPSPHQPTIFQMFLVPWGGVLLLVCSSVLNYVKLSLISVFSMFRSHYKWLHFYFISMA